MRRHVILGAGPAGVIAAETLRKRAAHDSVVVVGDEPEAPYSRMALPYLLMQRIDASGTQLRRDPAHYARQGIELRRAAAVAVDSAARCVALADGEILPFDTLLLATGSRPVRPPIEGLDLPGVHNCWTLEDARHIMDRARPGARVLQLGAGFIGCIILEALAMRGVQLRVVEMGERMVPRMMGPVAGGMIRDWCQQRGVEVLTGVRVLAIRRQAQSEVLLAQLSNGDSVEADLIISATGVQPAIGFLENSGIACLRGVLTDEFMQTNVQGIYAAGDCAEAFDKVSGKTIISAIQPNAAEQARVAACNMTAQGPRAELRGVTQINVLDTLGLVSASFGNWEGVPGGQHADLTDQEGWRHLSLQFDGDVLVGCNCVGWTQHLGAMRGLVEGQVHLGRWKDILLEDPTQLMSAYLACAQGAGAWNGADDTRRR